MAVPAGYGLRYRTGCYNESLGTCYVDIYKKSYSASSDSLTLSAESIYVILDETDYFTPIKSSSFSMSIINDKDDFYELDDLFSISDLEYYVRVYNNSVVFFAGYIPCSTVEQVWLSKGSIELNATCNLNRLGEYYPTIFTTKGLYSIIEILQNCLSFTQMDLPININCNLLPGGIFTGVLHDQTYIDSDAFYANNIELEDCQTILNKILVSFNSVIYYYNDEWYIERYKDLNDNPKQYYRFESDSSDAYHYDSTNTHLTMGTEIKPMRMSQRISYTPGLKRIELTLKEKRKLNYINYYFNDITYPTTLSLLEYISPEIGCWESLNEGTDLTVTLINNYNIITNGVSIDDMSNEGGTYSYQNGIDETNPSASYYQMRHSLYGIYTKFNLLLNDTNPTTINIAFKFALNPSFLNVFTYFDTDRWVHPNDHKFYVRLFIGTSGRNWLHMNTTTGKYEFRQQDDLTKYPNGGGYDWGLVQIEIPFDSFTDKVGLAHDFSTAITLDADIDVDSDNDYFIIGICELGYNNPLYATGDYVGRMNKANIAYKHVMYGDVFITANDELGDNLWTGDISNDFIDVGKLDVDFYDVNSLSLLNCLYINAPASDRTSVWYEVGHMETLLPLVKWVIRDRFQIFNKTRRKVTSDFKSTQFIKPLSLVNTTIVANKTFFVDGYRFNLHSSIYDNMNLKEYVNDDGIS